MLCDTRPQQGTVQPSDKSQFLQYKWSFHPSHHAEIPQSQSTREPGDGGEKRNSNLGYSILLQCSNQGSAHILGLELSQPLHNQVEYKG